MDTKHQLLQTYFGYGSFRPQQEAIIDAVLENKDVLVLMPTGGGKSVCFQIPALMKEGIALVISPLIALMKDQVEALKANGIAAEFINSSLNPKEEQEITQSVLAHNIKLLYLSPEKALSLAPSMLQSLPISMIAIDEAHCISQWGHDFRPEYAKLKSIRDLFSHIPIIALTATADKTTRKDIVNQLELREPQIFISSFDRANFHISVRSNIKERDKNDEIISFIHEHKDQAGIIYCLSRKNTEHLSSILKQSGIPAAYYHAGMQAEERSKVQEDFIFDKVKIICATIAFGMGIDKSNVRWVIHYNLPKNIEGYYQEIGRAGRDGSPVKTILYYNIKDLMMLNKFAAESGQVELNLEKLKRIQQYAESRVCRRKILMGYFGENYDRNCNSCDVCDDPPKYIDGTVIAQKAISGLMRAKENIGIKMLIDILRGSMNAEIVAAGYDKLKTHGVGKDISYADWQSHILQLLQIGVFEMAYDEGFILKVGESGKVVISGNQLIELAASSPKTKAKPAKEQASAIKYDELLFDQLRALRRNIAEAEGIPPYIVFHDSSLIEMSQVFPTGKISMMVINGVSQTKYVKYGKHFEQAIRTYLAKRKEQIDQYISPDNIKSYVEALQTFSIRISHTVLAKILLGSDREIGIAEIKELPFYGLLKHHITYKDLSSSLKQLLAANNIQTGTKTHRSTAKFFADPIKNELETQEIERYTNQISHFATNRPNDTIENDYILNTRKEYPRAYEYWNEVENEILTELCSKTNDLDFIATILKRNPSSIKNHYTKLNNNNSHS